MDDHPPLRKLPRPTRIVFGTIAATAATVLVHPIDVVKVRMQVRKKTTGPIETFRLIARCEGRSGLYAGLSAGLSRQAVQTSVRLYTYLALHDLWEKRKGAHLMTKDRLKLSVAAGLVAGLASTPTEVANVRMMVDGRPLLCTLTKKERPRRYRNIFHALSTIAREEGLRSLWRGCSLSLWRSVAVSVSHITTYSQMNEYIRRKNLKRSYAIFIPTALTAALIASCLSLPIDLVKNLFQYMSTPTPRPSQLFRSIVRLDGVRALWRGFVPYFVRLGPHTVVTFLIFERLSSGYLRRMEQIDMIEWEEHRIERETSKKTTPEVERTSERTKKSSEDKPQVSCVPEPTKKPKAPSDPKEPRPAIKK